MTLYDLYQRIIETTGLDVVTIGSLRTSVANCFADLTSRGYKIFTELSLESEEFKDKTETNYNMVILPMPKDVRKILYLRLYFPEQGAVLASRYSLTNKRVGSKWLNGAFRSAVEPGQAIFYTKGDKIYVEWHTDCGETLENLEFGYNKKLSMPSNFPTDEQFKTFNNLEALKDCVLDIRPEFEDALVFYAAYFYYARFQKDTDKINHYLSQYKYYVEDIVHELSYEDEFNEEDVVIKIEEDD